MTRLSELGELVREDRSVLRSGLTTHRRRSASPGGPAEATTPAARADAGRADYLLLVLGLLLVAAGAGLAVLGSFPG